MEIGPYYRDVDSINIIFTGIRNGITVVHEITEGQFVSNAVLQHTMPMSVLPYSLTTNGALSLQAPSMT